jgi:hypothetical protein
MWKISKPTVSAVDCFNTCIGRIRDVPLKARMESIRHAITAAETAFDQAAANADLHLILGSAFVGGVVTTQEMKDAYEQRMAKGGSRGRDIYDQLMIAAKGDLCPFCGHRNVSTLDHCLPKSQHPALAVTPINLVPSCKDCNHEKGTPHLTGKADQLLNAYYDDIEADLWLHAEIVQGSPAGARFFVVPNANWDAVTSQRVANHFDTLKLAKLYASQAGRQLQNMRGALGEIYDAAGLGAVREDLLRRHRSCSQVKINSWEAALYAASEISDWYCDGGFRA